MQKRKVPGNQRLRNGFDWWWCKELSAIFKVFRRRKPLLGGSPYQINFVYKLPETDSGLVLRNEPLRDCNDKEYKCACTDCEESCPKLPHAKDLTKNVLLVFYRVFV